MMSDNSAMVAWAGIKKGIVAEDLFFKTQNSVNITNKGFVVFSEELKKNNYFIGHFLRSIYVN